MVIVALAFINNPIFLFWVIIGLVVLYSSSQAVVPLNKRMPKDMLRLKAAASLFAERLIPWERKEIELLSLNTIEVQTNRRKGFETTGAFTSIYHEPVFSYGYKKYKSRKHYAVMYARTQFNELFYYEYPNGVEVQMNGVVLGRMLEDKLYGTDGSLLGNFLDVPLEPHISIIIGNKDVGHLLERNAYGNDVNPRALDLVVPDLSIEESHIFLAMILWKIVRENGLE